MLRVMCFLVAAQLLAASSAHKSNDDHHKSTSPAQLFGAKGHKSDHHDHHRSTAPRNMPTMKSFGRWAPVNSAAPPFMPAETPGFGEGCLHGRIVIFSCQIPLWAPTEMRAPSRTCTLGGMSQMGPLKKIDGNLVLFPQEPSLHPNLSESLRNLPICPSPP